MIKLVCVTLILIFAVGCNCNRENASVTTNPPAAPHDPHEHHGAGTFENKQVQIAMPADPSKPISNDGPCEANSTRVGFLTPFPVNGMPCAAEIQRCDGKQWIGAPLYAKCDPNGGPKPSLNK